MGWSLRQPLLLAASFAFALGLAKAQAAAPIGLISDVDDTIRLTGVLEERDPTMAARYMAKLSFPGMAELYHQILLASGARAQTDLHYVSGSPWFMDNAVEEFLEQRDFPMGDLVLRFRFVLDDLLGFKKRNFERILIENPRQNFIFIGDDTQHDVEAIAWIRARYPQRVTATYIHAIEGANPARASDLQTPFYTAIEVALHEMAEDRMTAGRVLAVARAMLEDPRFEETVVPDFADLCPPSGWLAALVRQLGLRLDGELSPLVRRIQHRTRTACEGAFVR